jgi:hypothetical protein
MFTPRQGELIRQVRAVLDNPDVMAMLLGVLIANSERAEEGLGVVLGELGYYRGENGELKKRDPVPGVSAMAGELIESSRRRTHGEVVTEVAMSLANLAPIDAVARAQDIANELLSRDYIDPDEEDSGSAQS